MISPANRRTEILPLTGIRAFAAWAVVLFHIGSTVPNRSALLQWFGRLGYLGVDLFFVLSGFIISYNYWDRFSTLSFPAYRQFLWLRLARLYPVHIFTLMVSAIFLLVVRMSGIVTAKNFSTWTLGNFIANALLVHAWRLQYVRSWNNASWSVSCEWFAYLVFPLLVLIGLAKLPSPILALGAIALPALWAFTSQSAHLPPCLLLIEVLCDFTAGCLVFQLYARRFQPNPTRRIPSLAVVFAGALLLILLEKFPQLHSDWTTLIFPPIILAVAESSGLFARLLGSSFAVYWGRLSYSLYMTHNVALWLLKEFLPIREGNPFALRFALYIVLIGIVSALTYHCVEEPSRKWLRARALRRSQPI